MGHEQRNAHVRSWPVPDVGVPELAGDTEPVELPPALAQAVEVLLVRKLEGGAEAPACVANRVRQHSAIGGLSKQPGARRIEEGQAHRIRRHLHPELSRRQTHALAVENLEWRACPAPRADIGGAGRVPLIRKLDAHDARATDGDLDLRAVMVKPHGRSAALEL